MRVYRISPNSFPEQYAWSGIGGWFGSELKFAGYDGFIIEGKAPKHPIFIEDDNIQFSSAEALWGLLVHQTQEKRKPAWKRCKSIVIGPAGENLCVMQVSPPAMITLPPKAALELSSAQRI